jgi:hypothetical protein
VSRFLPRIALIGVLTILGFVAAYYTWIYSHPEISLVQVPVAVAWVTQEEPTVLIIGYECGQFEDSTLRVAESSNTVTISVQTVLRAEACALGTQIRLENPLGGRAVIDAFSGNEIEVGQRLQPRG